MKIAPLIIFVFCFTGVATALNITNTSGRVYNDIELRRTDLNGIYIKHSSGIGMVMYDEMADVDKKAYGYNPEKIKLAQEAKQLKADKMALLAEKKALDKQKQELDLQKAAIDEANKLAEEKQAAANSEESVYNKSYQNKSYDRDKYADKIYAEKPSGDTTATGIPIHVGPRGGRYHYSKSGKKVYERKR